MQVSHTEAVGFQGFKWVKAFHLMLLLLTVTALHFLSLLYQKTIVLFSRDPNAEDRIHDVCCSWARTVFQWSPWWDLDLDGQENLPRDDEPRVVVVNHESATDIFTLYWLGLQFRWLAKASVFRIPIIGTAMRWAGYIPVHRGRKTSRKEAMSRSADVLKKGRCMAFFPEGTRSTTGEFRPFKPGAFRLSVSENVEILPVVLRGAGDLLKKGSIVPQRAVISMSVLPPMKAAEGESIEDFTERVRNKMIDVHKLPTHS
ncbi:MAG: lysophospholipid acyltransferase family protein [Oligoflexales bacterium]